MRSEIAWSDEESITVRGLDLCHDLIGHVTATELVALLVCGRLATEAETRMLDALLVSLAEHGITPSVIAARMTILGSPEALQGAVAAGLLGAGSVYLGTMEQTADMLRTAIASAGSTSAVSAVGISSLAIEVVSARRQSRLMIPGIGHPIHVHGDPRVPRLVGLAHEFGFAGQHLALLEEIARVASGQLSRPMPINVAGVVGAIAAEMGLDTRIIRGIGILARCIGLLGHLQEEIANPIAPAVWSLVADSVASPGSS